MVENIELRKKILDLVKEHHGKNGEPLRLAQLGGLLTKQERDSIRVNGLTLSKFISAELSEELEEKLNEKKAVVVSSRSLNYIPQITENSKTHGVRPVYPKFYRKLWNLFSGRFPASKVYVSFEENNLEVIYKAESEEVPTGSIEVLEKDFPQSENGSFLSARVIDGSIRSWAERNSLPIERIIDIKLTSEKALRLVPLVSGTGNLESGDALKNLLCFLNSLQPVELAQLSLSGSFVLGVLKRSML